VGKGTGTPVACLLMHKAACGLHHIYCVYKSLHSIYNEVYYRIELAVRRAMTTRHVGAERLHPRRLPTPYHLKIMAVGSIPHARRVGRRSQRSRSCVTLVATWMLAPTSPSIRTDSGIMTRFPACASI